VHAIDHIASLVACILRLSGDKGSCPSLKAKTWDLADAYKQVPLSESAFEKDAYLVVYSPVSKGPEVFRQKLSPSIWIGSFRYGIPQSLLRPVESRDEVAEAHVVVVF